MNLEIIKNIFLILGVSITNLKEANNFAQKNLLRTGEFWDPQQETNISKIIRANKDALLQELKAIGMIDAIYPKQKDFDYALLLGSLKDDVIMRINFLEELINTHYHFKQIVILASQRPLLETEGKGTEAEMLSGLFKLKFPNKKFILINTPMFKDRRPTTADTLKDFNALNLKPGSCLVISNNPYILRQTKVAQDILDQTKFPTQGCGPAFKEDYIDIVLVMDEFARLLYIETNILE